MFPSQESSKEASKRKSRAYEQISIKENQQVLTQYNKDKTPEYSSLTQVNFPPKDTSSKSWFVEHDH